MMEDFRAINPKAGLKDIIHQILSNHRDTLTVDNLVNSLKRARVQVDVNPAIVNRVLKKMAKQGIVEFVYLDLSYGVRLKRNVSVAG